MNLVKVIHLADENWLPVSRLSIHPGILDILEELGVIEVTDEQVEQKSLQRLNKITRLREALGLNLNGAILIADLLDRVAELEDEILRLKGTR